MKNTKKQILFKHSDPLTLVALPDIALPISFQYLPASPRRQSRHPIHPQSILRDLLERNLAPCTIRKL